MKLIIKFLFFLLILFLLNVIFYFLSDNYKFFLQKLKYNEDVIYIEDEKNNNIVNNDNLLKINNNKYNAIVKNDSNNSMNSMNINTTNKEIKKEIILGNNYNKVLNLFKMHYGLKEIEINSTLFELIDEYPDHYIEYYSKELTIYFFTTKTYKQVYEIFNYLQDSLPFSINEVNNFGEKSFYINLKEDMKDNYVRIVISKNGVDFGLKIKNDEYNKVKEILLKL